MRIALKRGIEVRSLEQRFLAMEQGIKIILVSDIDISIQKVAKRLCDNIDAKNSDYVALPSGLKLHY
jgi:hypothetical protein